MIKNISAPLSGEDATIAAIDRILGAQALPPGWIGIGDDAAVTSLTPGQQALTTTDLLVEGVHFRRGTTAPRELGWKAIAVNVSDIAGMGGTVRWATVSLALPLDVSLEWVKAFYRGVAEFSQSIGLAVVGGDTVGSPGTLMIAVTVVGEAARPILRTGAQVGDRVLVTSPLGDSAAGLWCLEHPERAASLSAAHRQALIQAHVTPRPALEEGRLLGTTAHRLAMMDNSDGLARSILWLAGANRLRIELQEANLPMTEAMRAVAATAGVAPSSWALYGGEDYNLVLTCPPAALSDLAELLSSVGSNAICVGTCVAGEPGAYLVSGTRVEPLEPGRTFQHLPL